MTCNEKCTITRVHRFPRREQNKITNYKKRSIAKPQYKTDLLSGKLYISIANGSKSQSAIDIDLHRNNLMFY